MIKYLKIVCFIFAASFVSAQEYLAPLGGNPVLIHRYNEQIKNPDLTAKPLSIADTIRLPFFEDFYYADRSPYPTSKYWSDSSVYVNTGFGIAPPSIGVATFDGLNSKGYPYDLGAQPVISDPADFLTSNPVDLLNKAPGIKYQLQDSLAFSFLYQSAGFGDNPEISDSLVLEFYKPLYVSPTNTSTVGQWFQVWNSRGVVNPVPLDSTFKKAMIFIKDTAYLHLGFKFRFRNKATTSGSLDHWNVDYIYFDRNRSTIGDTAASVYEDIAFSYVSRPLLKYYSAMPYKQYKPQEMGQHFSNFIRYNGVTPTSKNYDYHYEILDKNNTVFVKRDRGALVIKNFNKFGYQKDTIHSAPYIDTIFPYPLADTTQFKVRHIIKTPTEYSFLNDTVTQIQPFYDYYAYDDGTAEWGYYLNKINAKIAQRFTLNVTDTLQAMDIFFDPVTNNTNQLINSFRMYVWNAGMGQPGTVLLRDSSMKPKYLNYGYNRYPRYALTSPLILGPGTYYFGIQQALEPLNIGFDKNIDRKNFLFFDVNNGWQQSQVSGSLMIHPVFGRPSFAIGIKETNADAKEQIMKLYPNPASEKLYIAMAGEAISNHNIEIYSMLGQLTSSFTVNEPVSEINTSELASGIYFVVLKKQNTIVSQQKLIISR